MWNRRTLECEHTLTGHTGSVLCLQYDDNIIISGSSDSTVRLVVRHRQIKLNYILWKEDSNLSLFVGYFGHLELLLAHDYVDEKLL